MVSLHPSLQTLSFSFSSTSSLPPSIPESQPQQLAVFLSHTPNTRPGLIPSGQFCQLLLSCRAKQPDLKTRWGSENLSASLLPPHPTVLTETHSVRGEPHRTTQKAPQPSCHPFCFGLSGYQARPLRAKHSSKHTSEMLISLNVPTFL